MTVTVTQFYPLTLTLPHTVSNPVIKPRAGEHPQGGLLEEMTLITTIHELLFKVTKDSHVFRIGAAVPLGTTNLP